VERVFASSTFSIFSQTVSVLAAMPDLELDDIRAGLRYASRQAQHLID